MAKNQAFSDQLRVAVLSAAETRYRISKATGIPESNLSRFVHGDGGLSLESVDKLCKYLGLWLTGGPEGQSKRRAKKGT